MIGSDFYYDNHALSDYGLIMAKPDAEQSFAPRTTISTDQSSRKAEKNILGVSYDDILLLNFFIIKNPCLYPQQKYQCFTQNELRDIRSWLESPKTSKELVIENKTKSGNETICYFGVFTEVQPFVINTNCYGLKLTFHCNAPYGYSVPMTHTYELSKYTNTFDYTYICPNDEKYDFVYPVIKIYLNTSIVDNGYFTITNISDNNNSLTIKLPSISTLIIDGKKKQILDENNVVLRLYDLGLNTDEIFDYTSIFNGSISVYWPRLVYGENSLEFTTTVSGSVLKIEIIARFVRKADGF